MKQDKLGSANGAGMMAVSLGKFLGPVILTPVFAWSIEEPYKPFPFDRFFAFGILCLMAVFCAVCIQWRLAKFFDDVV